MKFKIGETVRFRRSDGSWSVGEVKCLKGDYVNIFWLSENGDVADKKCHKLQVKKLRSKKMIYLVVLVVLIISLLLIDSFYYTKKVWFYFVFD
jgi:hypothetical protein